MDQDVAHHDEGHAVDHATPDSPAPDSAAVQATPGYGGPGGPAPAVDPAMQATRVRGPPFPRRAPLGVAAALSAAVLVIPVVFFDALEGMVGALGIDGGLPVLLLLVVLFALLWLVAGAALALFSPAPAREGLAAGLLVAAVMAAMLVVAGRAMEGNAWPLVLVWAVFATLAVGLGAVTGMVARSIQGRARSIGSWGQRAPALAAVACGIVLLLAAVPFMPGGGAANGAAAAMVWMVVAFSAVLVVGGVWGWRRAC